MQKFVLDQPRILVLSTVSHLCTFSQRNPNPKLLFKPAPRGDCGRLLRPGVSAAGIRPARREVVFAVGPTLQQQTTLSIKDQDREGPVESSVAVRIQFTRSSEGLIILIDEDDLLGGIALPHAFNLVSG